MALFRNILSKRTNAFDGAKAHNDFSYIKIGRVEYNSWMNVGVPVGDIIVSERELVHIYADHKRELDSLAIDAFTYVSAIINECVEIRSDNRGGYYFTCGSLREDGSKTADSAVVELEELWFEDKRVYVIKTARPMKWDRLIKYELLCVKPRA